MENLYKISNHAKQRYSERILNKSDANEIQRFMVAEEDKIKVDINKMIYYGELIYTGKQSQKDGKGKTIDVYLKDSWVVLVDGKSELVVTLYKIDLGCGDDFNSQYIDRMLEKLSKSKENFETVQAAVNNESATYKNMIDEAMIQINEYKKMIKHLEELCSAYQIIIDNNIVSLSQANQEITDVVNTLIGKKEF